MPVKIYDSDGNGALLRLDKNRKRLTLGIVNPVINNLEQQDLIDADLITKGDADALYRDAYPVGEVFCLGVIKLDSNVATATATGYGFKYATPTIGAPTETTSATNMDYFSFTVSDYKPTAMTIDTIWLELSGTERDNKIAYYNGLTEDGTGTEIRVYSADNSDWSGDNVMGYDDDVIFIKIMAVASA